MDRNTFELKCQELVGHIVTQVMYYEIEYQNGEQFWNRDPRFDSLDYGLDLMTKDGEVFGIIWDNEFFPYGVSIKNEPLLGKHVINASIIDVSTSSRWSEILGQKIVQAKIVWSWVKEGNGKEKIYYPQDLVIQVESGQEVFISALEIENGRPHPIADHITVMFDRSIAATFQVATADISFNRE